MKSKRLNKSNASSENDQLTSHKFPDSLTRAQGVSWYYPSISFPTGNMRDLKVVFFANYFLHFSKVSPSIHSLILLESFMDSIIRLLTDAWIHHSVIDSCMHWLINWLVHSLLSSLIHSFIDWLIESSMCSFIHSFSMYFVRHLEFIRETFGNHSWACGNHLETIWKKSAVPAAGSPKENLRNICKNCSSSQLGMSYRRCFQRLYLFCCWLKVPLIVLQSCYLFVWCLSMHCLCVLCCLCHFML